MRLKRTWATWAIALLTLALVASACGTSDESEDLEGAQIEVMASWGGDEQAGFEEVIAAFEADTGVDVTYVSERELTQVLPTRVAGGNPPDVAMVPRPGVVQALVDDGAAVSFADLGVDADLLSDAYSQGILDFGTFNGELYGLQTATDTKNTFWYKPPSFAEQGFTVPETWADLGAIVDGYVAAGKVPLSIGGLDGWTLTDWFESIFVRVAGPEVYNQLFLTHEIEWTDPIVVEAMNKWAEIVLPADQKLLGGAAGTNSTGFTDAWDLVLGGDAELHYEGGFIGNFGQQNFPELTPVDDYDYFQVPEIDSMYGKPTVGSGDMAVAFKNNAATRAFIEWLASKEANEIWATAAAGARLTPNQLVSADLYTDPLLAKQAADLQAAEIFVFDGSDLAPGAVGGDAMFTGFQNFINGDSIQSVLEFIENAADGAY